MGHALATLIGTSTYPGASSPAVSGTMAGNITGNWIHVAGKTGATFQFTWTDVGGAQNPSGLFGLEMSNEYHPQSNPSASGVALTLAAADTTGLTAATVTGGWAISVDLAAFPCMYLRPVYARTSGAGTAICTVVAA
jgi:hypothetical protein